VIRINISAGRGCGNERRKLNIALYTKDSRASCGHQCNVMDGIQSNKLEFGWGSFREEYK
jgi:hypothetical protein